MIKRYPLAIVSLVIGIVSFFQFFGLEKAVMAIVFGALALKNVPAGEEKGKRYAYSGIILGCLYIVTLLVILAAKWPQLMRSMGK
jgi:hypothetical protein